MGHSLKWFEAIPEPPPSPFCVAELSECVTKGRLGAPWAVRVPPACLALTRVPSGHGGYEHAEKSRQGNICSPGWLHSPLLSSLVLLYECWSHSMTGNPIIIVIVVIIITTQVGTQKLTSGKLRHKDCFVLLLFFIAYFYDRSVFQQMLSPSLL